MHYGAHGRRASSAALFVGVTFLSIGYQAMKAIATFLVTWYNYFSRRFFLEGAQS